MKLYAYKFKKNPSIAYCNQTKAQVDEAIAKHGIENIIIYECERLSERACHLKARILDWSKE